MHGEIPVISGVFARLAHGSRLFFVADGRLDWSARKKSFGRSRVSNGEDRYPSGCASLPKFQ
jgi:hypothetical protein